MGALLSMLRDLFSGRKLEMCIVGLENSGKTTLLNVLAQGEPMTTLPTVGLNLRKVKKDNVTMKVWDMGGQERFRSEWAVYAATSDVVLFVVDASDTEKISVAKKELHQLLDDKALEHKPLLVLLNKIDVQPTLSKTDAVKVLSLDYINSQRNPWVVIPISALHKTNVTEVVQWLIEKSGR
ncbi:Arl8b [Acrasis kona]|uniref:Arl8b n=1 Tax=Acrasis kona TaxID=1008807 RepID=A0AAW2YST7_9EUKA